MKTLKFTFTIEFIYMFMIPHNGGATLNPKTQRQISPNTEQRSLQLQNILTCFTHSDFSSIYIESTLAHSTTYHCHAMFCFNELTLYNFIIPLNTLTRKTRVQFIIHNYF